MTWITLSVVSYLLLALVNLGDKFVIDKILGDSRVYAFMVAILGSILIIIAPWFLKWPGLFLFLINILAGAFFIFALWTMYEALKKGEASRVVVVVGSIVPVFTLIFSLILFKERFSLSQWLGIFFLLAGMLQMSLIVSRRKKWSTFTKRTWSVFSGKYKKRWILLSIASAWFYAIFFISSKYAYSQQEFLSAFIWTRLGGLSLALIFLIDPSSRKAILKSFKTKKKFKNPLKLKKEKKPQKFLVVLNQALGALAAFLQNYAIYLGPVAIINALQGVQYAFLLLLGIFFSIFFPKILKEDISRAVLIRKGRAILLVGIGLYLILK